MKKKLPIISSVLCLASLVSCSDPIINKGEWIVASENSLTLTSISGVNVPPFNCTMILKYFQNETKTYDASLEETINNEFKTLIRSLHKKFDRHFYYYDNNVDKNIVTSVKTINDSYGTNKPIKCDDDLYTLLKYGHTMTKLTNGLFNFYMGELNDFWDDVFYEILENHQDYHELDPYFSASQKEKIEKFAFAMPKLEEIDSLLTFNDVDKTVIFNTLDDITYNGEVLSRSTKDSIYRPTLTTGGIAKGLAVDIVKKHFKEMNLVDGYINAGSSSFSSLSAPTFFEKGYQKFSIVDPRTSRNSFIRDISITIKMKEDYGMSTSGNYNAGSYYIDDENTGKRIYRHHILNPYTGECSQEHSSVSLISKTFSNVELDALSTAFVNLPLEDCIKLRQSLLNQFPSHDLSFIIMDIGPKDKLNIHVSKEMKGVVSKEAKNCKIIYE